MTAASALGRLESKELPPDARGVVATGKASAVVAVDVTGRVIYVNAIMESFSGSPRHDLLDQPLSSVFGPDRAGAGRSAMTVTRRAMNGNRWAWLLEDCLLSSEEAPSRAMEFHAEPIRERDGSVTGAVLVFCQVGH